MNDLIVQLAWPFVTMFGLFLYRKPTMVVAAAFAAWVADAKLNIDA